jgi:hypothetical protein
MEGYVKLYRSSLNDPLYLKEPFTKWQAWCDLILLAYFAPADFFVRGIKVKAKRGCVYKGVLELADRWKWSRGKVLRFLSYLVSDKRIGIQNNNVISCISITNYEKYQQNGSTNESTNGSTNESTNEHLIRRTKEDNNNNNNNNNIKAVSQFCDDGFGKEQMDLLLNMQAQLAELKERLDTQEKPAEKKSKKKPVSPLITKGRELFESRYADLFEGGVYYWQAKDAAAMDALTKKIIHSRQQRGMSIEEDDVLKALTAFLNSITDPWLLKNFSVTSINGKYNEIVAQARAAANNVSNGTNKSNKEGRAQDAASIIARLAAQEGTDDNPIRG